MVKMENISFGYTEGQDVLSDISLHIRPGECVLLCGESGCGKTTVTKLINGLIPHFTENAVLRGNVYSAGMPAADTEMYELAKRIGSVFQNPKSQFFSLDTDSELAFGLENEGTPPNEMRERIDAAVKDLGIQNLLHRNIFSLSGGEKQMLAFSGVYAMEPSVFVLDEPTANLDEDAIRRLRSAILLLKKKGHTVVIAEHRLYFLADLIDRAFYLKNGQLSLCLSKEELSALPEARRKELGLRSLHETNMRLSAAGEPNGAGGLEVKALSCGYKKNPDILTNLSFAAIPGEVLAVTGSNGTGKTTLVRCLCGLLKERGGRIMLDGKHLKAKDRRRQSFLVMQDVNHQLFFDSVWNECEQASGGQTDASKIESVLEQFELLPFRERHPMSLSGGQKQRLAVVTALLSGRRLLIFDEPTSGLDYRHMCEVGEIIRFLAKQGHIILFFDFPIDKVYRKICRFYEAARRHTPPEKAVQY